MIAALDLCRRSNWPLFVVGHHAIALVALTPAPAVPLRPIGRVRCRSAAGPRSIDIVVMDRTSFAASSTRQHRANNVTIGA